MLRSAPNTDHVQTTGSGYSLISLSGPPPGDRITVTVESATCATSE
jgi:hypothetical protein